MPHTATTMMPLAKTTPPTPSAGRRQALARAAWLALAVVGWAPQPVLAHGYRTGDLVVDHPYATPTPPGARTGAVYLRGLSNRSRFDDQLLGGRTAVADRVEVHRAVPDGQGGGPMRAVEALGLPAGSNLGLRHGGDTQLVLVGLKAPLQPGQRFTLWLRFARAGELAVDVDVLTPRDPQRHRH